MRTILPVTFGAGLDRATGKSSVDRQTFQDLRNVYLEDARLRLRQGLQATGYPVLAAGTDVCAVAMLEATLDIVYVLYERSTRAVTVARLNPLTSATMQTVGTWGTVNSAATLPPPIEFAESYGKLYLAHAEPVSAYRLTTQVYTPNATDATVGAIAALQCDLNGDGAAADVHFRGVLSWNDSLVGYGYGEETSTASQDRPEVVRISKPGDPSVFLPEAYFLAGKRSTPVTGLAALPGVGLIVAKTTSTYLIFGTDAETYGIREIDPNYGNVADRAMLSVHGAVWMWSVHGPRITTGDETIDMSATLGLDAPQPDSLAVAGDIKYAYAFHDLASDTIEFAFPRWDSAEGPTLFYVASVRDPGNIRWSYHERAGCLPCASTVLLGKQDLPSISAYADFTAQADSGLDPASTAAREVTVTWDNLGSYIGSESYEVYVKPSGGTWTLHTTVPHNNASAQTLVMTGLVPLTAYSIAIRATRSGLYTTGYADASPDDWSAGTAALSKTTVTTAAEIPVMLSGRWYQTPGVSGDFVEVSFSRGDTGGVPFIFEKSADNSTWVEVAAYPSPGAITSVVYTAASGETEASMYFRITPKRGSVVGTSATGLLVYIGPTVASHGFALLASGYTIASDIAHLALSFNPASGTPASLGVLSLNVEFSDDGSSWSALTLPWSFQSARRNQYYRFTAVGLVNPGTNYLRWRAVVSNGGAALRTPWASTSWVGDATVITMDTTWSGVGFPKAPSDSATVFNTLAAGAAHWLTAQLAGASDYIMLKRANYDALLSQPQGLIVEPSDAGLTEWPVGAITFRTVKINAALCAGEASQGYTVSY